MENVELRVWLSGETAENEDVKIKLNGILLPAGQWSPDPMSQHPMILQYTERPATSVAQKDGWRIFPAEPGDFATGPNIISIRIEQQSRNSQSEVVIQKLEAHVKYKRQ